MERHRTVRRVAACVLLAVATFLLVVGWLEWRRLGKPTALPASPLPTPTVGPTVPPPVYGLHFPLVYTGLGNRGGAALVRHDGLPERAAQMIEAIGADIYHDWYCVKEVSTTVPYLATCFRPGSGCEGGRVAQTAIVAGCNEPDNPDQCDTSPHDYAIWWHDVMEVRFADRLKISPAPSSYYLGWLPEWRGEYVALYGEQPDVDVLAVHCYGGLEWCKAQVYEPAMQWARDWEIPGGVWVTEFAPTDRGMWDYGPVVQYIRDSIDYFKSEPLIAAWFWFPLNARCDGSEYWCPPSALNPGLVYENASLTPLGEAWVEVME